MEASKSSELLARVWPGPRLDIGAPGRHPWRTCQTRQLVGVPVHGVHGMPARGEEAGMPPVPARNVEDPSPRRDPVSPPCYPRRWSKLLVGIAAHYGERYFFFLGSSAGSRK